MEKKNIILIGYMGVGKTTLGQSLSRKLNCKFCDLDWFIEENMDKTISQIFAEHGEDGFRRVEQQMLHKVAEKENMVISVGGGTPCFFDNIEFMNEHAKTIYIQASPETLKTHIRMGNSKRPLVDGKTDEEMLQYIIKSLKKREPFYLKAHYKVQIGTITNNEQIDKYVDAIRNIIDR